MDNGIFRNPITKPKTWHRFSLDFYPALMILLIYSAWGTAVVKLGAQPIPYKDDPKFMGLTLHALHIIGYAMMLCFPVAAYGAVKSAIARFKQSQWLQVLIPISIWLACAIILTADPWGAFKWFID